MSLVDSLTHPGGIGRSASESRPTSPGLFFTGVVREFISNPAALESEERDSIQSTVVGGEKYVNRMPRNSMVVEIIGNSKPRICYPFFSPHLSLPVKPGEQVWVLFPDGGVGEIGYWLTRKSTDLKVDDLNYTHLPRIGLFNQSSTDTDSSDFETFPFPKGPGIDSLSNPIPGVAPYKKLKANSSAYKDQFTGEPVPRFSKRCPDLILQGSNNTLICLGEDRGVTVSGDTAVGTTSTDTSVKSQGTIDIVVGRGMPGSTSEGVGTGPTDTPGDNIDPYDELNKIPGLTGKGGLAKEDVDNANEGDPDFKNDLSRIYLSMNTDGDSNLSLSYPDTGTAGVKPYAIVKSDEVRLVARETGSVRIIKEGSNTAVITMLSDGKILIDSSNVMIGAGATEQIVLGNVLTDLIGQIIDQINLISVPTGVGPSGPPVNAAAFSAIKAQLSTALSGIGKIK